MPRAAQGVLSALQRYTRSTVPRRVFVTGTGWSDGDSIELFVDFNPSGSLLGIGAGLTGTANSVPAYVPAGQDSQLEVGDTFSIDSQDGGNPSQYRVGFVTPIQYRQDSADAFYVVWLTAVRPVGEDAP